MVPGMIRPRRRAAAPERQPDANTRGQEPRVATSCVPTTTLPNAAALGVARRIGPVE